MFTPLETRLTELRQRVRRTLLINGVCWLITVLVGSMVVIGVADWLFRFGDAGVRLILSLAVVATTAYVAYRRLIAPLLVRLNDLDLALWIERLHPGLKDSLASTVQFLKHGIDPAMGSPELQRQVVDETTKHLQNVDFDEVVQTRYVKRIMWAATTVSLATAILVGLNRADASIAFQRMVLPLSATNWPKQTQLRVLGDDFQSALSPEAPLRIAIGETLTMHIDNARGRLPEVGTIYYRFPGEQQTEQQLTPLSITDRDNKARDVFVASLLVLEGPIQFRVEAGDDQEMPWFTIEAIVPPNLDDLQITLTPPEYLGQPAVDLPPGTGHVEGVIGTNVAIKARSDKPLLDANLHVYEQAHPLDVGREGLTFEAEFLIRQPDNTSYWLAFRDREGRDEGQSRHYDLRGIEDRVPEIEITQPATNLRVTPQAKVPLRMVAKDDYGLTEIRLVYRRDTGVPDPDTLENLHNHIVSLFNDASRPQHQTSTHELDLSTMELQPGETITLHAEATDAFDLGDPHVGKSLPRTLTVVTVDEKRQELADRQADIMAELQLAQKQQEAAHEQVRQLQIQLDEAGELRPQDIDTLQQSEMAQRRAAMKLTDEETGVRQRAQQLLNDLRDNVIDDAETTGRMTTLDEELQRLAQDNLPRIEEELTAVRKREQAKTAGEAAQTDVPENSADDAVKQKQSLDRAAKDQQIVSEALNEALKEMAKWRTHRDLAGDLDQLIESQQELNRDAEQLSKQTLTKSASELTPQERSDLQRLGERQTQAAKRLDQLKSKVEETLASGTEADKTSTEAQLLEDVAEQIQEQSTAARMRETARQLQKNDVGKATQNQQELLKQLQDLHDTFQNRRETDTAEMIKKLKQEEQQLAKLKDRQEELMRKIEKAQELQDPDERQQELEKLKKEQQQLRDEVEKMARRLRRLQIQKGRDSTARAAQRQQQAAEDLNKDDPIAAAEQAQEALDDLEQAQRELAQQRREAEEQLAQEQLEKIADELRAMIPRQQGVIDETARLQGLLTEQGKWSRGTLRSLLGLTEVQRGLQSETEQLVETLTAAEVFALALKGAARDMDRAAQRLSERQTDETTQRDEMRAKQRFIDLAEALKPDEPDESDAQQQQQQDPQQQGPGGEQGGPQTDGIPQLSQLKVLKTLQSDLKERTVELAARLEAADEITRADRQELQNLALEQTELADLTRNLTKITAAADEEPALEEIVPEEIVPEENVPEADQ